METLRRARQSPIVRSFAGGTTLLDGRRPAPWVPSLRISVLWSFLGNAIYAGCQWGILVVLAKLGGPEMVGQFALSLAVTAPVLMFCNLQLRSVQATDTAREYAFGDYLGLRLITAGIALLAIGGLVAVSGYPRTTAAVILLVGLAKALESISEVFYGLLQQHERMDRLAIAQILKGVLSLALVGGIVWRTGNLIAGSAGLVVSWGALLAANDRRNGRLVLGIGAPAPGGERTSAPLLPRWNLATLLGLVWLALPLGVVMLLISLNANIPRYVVEQQLGTPALGLFAALASLLVVGNTVVGALGQSASPRLARHYAAGDRAAFLGLLRTLTGLGLFLGVAGVAATLVAGEPLLRLLYRAEYAAQSGVLLLLMVGGGLGYIASLLGYAMTAARSFRAQAPLFLATGGVTIAACWLLIPRYHLSGAALALTLAAGFQLAGCLVIVAVAVRRLATGKEAPS